MSEKQQSEKQDAKPPAHEVADSRKRDVLIVKTIKLTDEQIAALSTGVPRRKLG